MKEAVPPLVVRGLQLARAARANDTPICDTDVDAFVTTPIPELSPMGFSLQETFHALRGVPRPAVSSYLKRVAWLEDHPEYPGALRLSDLGLAVLESVESESTQREGTLREIVVHPDAPLEYAVFLDEVSKLTDVMVIDRYASVLSILQLSTLLPVTRILSSGNATRTDDGEEARVRNLKASLGQTSSHAEVRFLNKDAKRLHDRFVLPRVGRGLMLGGSLGGVATNTIVALSQEMTAALRDSHEALWDEAKTVTPIRIARASEADETMNVE